LVDAPTQDLEGPGHSVGVNLLCFGCLSLEDDLRTAPEVQTQPDGPSDHERDGCSYDGENGERSPENVT